MSDRDSMGPQRHNAPRGISFHRHSAKSEKLGFSGSKGGWPSNCRAAERGYATSSDGKISPPVLISFIDLVTAGNETRDSKRKSHSQQCHRWRTCRSFQYSGRLLGNQLVTTLDAGRPKFRTTIGHYRRHGSLPHCPSLCREEAVELWRLDHAAIRLGLDQDRESLLVL